MSTKPKSPIRSESTAESPSAESFAVVFARVEAEARALAPAQLRFPRLDVERLAASVLDGCPRLLALRPEFEKHGFPLWPLDNLRSYALVAAEAHVAHQPMRGAEPAEAAALTTSNEALAGCKTEAFVLVTRGLIPKAEFDGIPVRPGFRNNGLALMRYARIFQGAWQKIERTTTLTTATLAEYEALAARLLAIAGERDAAKVAAPDDMRLRKFTLLDNALVEVNAALAFLFRHEPERIDDYLPRLKKPTKAKSAAGDVKAPDAEDEKPAGPEEEVKAAE